MSEADIKFIVDQLHSAMHGPKLLRNLRLRSAQKAIESISNYKLRGQLQDLAYDLARKYAD